MRINVHSVDHSNESELKPLMNVNEIDGITILFSIRSVDRIPRINLDQRVKLGWNYTLRVQLNIEGVQGSSIKDSRLKIIT